MAINKLKFNIDSPNKKKKFIIALKKIFKDEFKGNTFKVAVRECDIIEFAFKDNGFIKLNRNDILRD